MSFLILTEFLSFLSLCLLCRICVTQLKCFCFTIFIWQSGSHTWDGLVLKETTISLWWIYWALVLRIYSISVPGNCPSKLFSCLLIRWWDVLYCVDTLLIYFYICFKWGNLELFADKSSEFVHSKSFLHRDIKPDNFLMGLGRRANQVLVWCLLLQSFYFCPFLLSL